MLQNRRLWDRLGSKFYDFIVVDEVHHGPATSYRNVFDKFDPTILLGLTATPERMDGQSVAADFGNRFAAEIRLPEALDEKLLCPFHYFAVADPISTADDRFWRNGKYDSQALENVYTGAGFMAKQRVQTVLTALQRLEPDLGQVHGIGFCVSVRHAEFMAAEFNTCGIRSGVLVGETNDEVRSKMLRELRSGEITFLFTRDVLNEGLDVPEVNTVLFLRPTESLTVFLQQLGRGLRHAPEKDCLTVLDLVGQVHRRYRIDRKLKALLPKLRFNIEREVEMDFPHLPSGCSIQLDRVAREHVLSNIRENFRNLAEQVPERLRTFEVESGQPLTFSNFVRHHDYEPATLLTKDSWVGWRARAGLVAPSKDPDQEQLQASLVRLSDLNGHVEIRRLRSVASCLIKSDVSGAVREAAPYELSVHYRLWGKPGSAFSMESIEKSFERLAQNQDYLGDAVEILEWAESETRVMPMNVELPYPSSLELHATYTNSDIKAALGLATFQSAGQTGVGLLHSRDYKTYATLVTFQKTEREFSPTTMYADYPISRELLHWESPSNTTQASETGQNLIYHADRQYTILIFARAVKRQDGRPVPFTFLGAASRVSVQQERPIQIVWELTHSMPVEMFEENRRGG
jgi:superfamily II DNA or RNA helicase